MTDSDLTSKTKVKLSIFAVKRMIGRSNNILDEVRKEIETSLIVAHRGYAKGMDFERNTVPAFKYAIEQGAHGIETDLRLTKDNKVVTHHDPWIRKGLTAKRIRTNDYDELLELLDQPEELPLIQDVYPLIPKNKPLFLQIKTPDTYDEITRQLENLSTDLSNIIIMGYVKPVLENNLSNNFVYGKHYLLPRKSNIDYIVNKIEMGNNIPIASPYYRFLTKSHLQFIQNKGFQVALFTVNNMKKVKSYIESGVDVIYTDKLKEVLNNFY